MSKRFHYFNYAFLLLFGMGEVGAICGVVFWFGAGELIPMALFFGVAILGGVAIAELICEIREWRASEQKGTES